MCEPIYNVLWWEIEPYAEHPDQQKNGRETEKILGAHPSGLIIDEVKELFQVSKYLILVAGAAMSSFSILCIILYYTSMFILFF